MLSEAQMLLSGQQRQKIKPNYAMSRMEQLLTDVE
jgi:hypothetical protein